MFMSLGLASSVTFSANTTTAIGAFKVLIIINKACPVTGRTRSYIKLCSVSSSAININGTNNITINCSKTTFYFIGLFLSTANGG